MRTLVITVVAGLSVLAASSAGAQDRSLVIQVKPRSWLDAGKTVEVGSMQNYMYDTQGLGDWNRFGSRGGANSVLPDRFASGRGGFVFETPRLFND